MFECKPSDPNDHLKWKAAGQAVLTNTQTTKSEAHRKLYVGLGNILIIWIYSLHLFGFWIQVNFKKGWLKQNQVKYFLSFLFKKIIGGKKRIPEKGTQQTALFEEAWGNMSYKNT